MRLGLRLRAHVASPILANVPRNEDELIAPARDGALRVLRAARDAGVKQVVLTSSFAAIGYGRKEQTAPFDETVWTDPEGENVLPYHKSKTLAERAALDFLARVGGGLELSVINLPELGKRKNAASAKARRLLGWTPRPAEEAVVATAESLARLGLLRDSPKKTAA